MKKLLLVTLVIFSLVIVSNTVYANNSLWSDEAAGKYEDRPDYQAGDIITVLIEEDANAVQSANTSTSQSSSIEAQAGTGLFNFIKAFGLGYSDQGSADGQTQRSGTLEADITTQVEDVLDNGNLRIIGSKKIKINGEEQIIKLSGIIRPEDIKLDNEVSSQKVADASIEYEGRGPVAEKQEPGLFEKVLNFFF
ncbi:MAG TPA: flagellar basal body L-ring protein FlgH [Halanaerobiales bacterium]|nr:flagellar basal body L-ring protein FlgH [Halanaerobiales bacterium]